MMARFFALMAFIGLTRGIPISQYASISDNVGVYDDWVKLDPSVVTNDGVEDFGLVYAGEKLYMVSRRNGSAVHGGIVSTLIDGKWKHARFDELESDDLQDRLFTLAGRMLMLTTGEKDGRIIFSKLFAWDDDSCKWMDLRLDIQDKDNIFQPLARGPNKFIGIDVPDQDGTIAYVMVTNHAMAKNDSETSLSKLEIVLDDSSKKPINASLKFVIRLKSEMAKAIVATIFYDTRLYVVVGKFTEGLLTVDISIDYAIDLANKNSKVDGIPFDNAISVPFIEYSFGIDLIFRTKGTIIFVGTFYPLGPDLAARRFWIVDLPQKKLQQLDSVFAPLPLPPLSRTKFAFDQKNIRFFTGSLKTGAFAGTYGTLTP